MRQQSYGIRHASIIDASAYKRSITVVGAGAIGSYVAMSLARMGYDRLTIVDFDEVSEENMGSQGYYISDIGKPKVAALASHILNATGITVTQRMERIDSFSMLSDDIIIASVDSMNARMDIFKACQRKGWFIDPRMGAEYAKMYVHDLTGDQSKYKSQWYPDSEALDQPCTAKATVYCANILAGFVVKAVKDITTGQTHMRSLDFDIKLNSGLAWDATGNRLF